MHILVTGAGGFIGSRFCALAVEAGHEVTALIRPRQGRTIYPAGEIVYGDLPYDVPARAWQGVNAVVHCAGATTGQDAAESHAINVEGTRVLLDEARRRGGIERFVFLSSQSAHEQAVSAYGRTKLEAEQVVRASGITHAILRPGLVFGPGPQGLFYRTRRTVQRLPVLPLFGGGKAIVQGIDVSDLCRAILRCLAWPAGESLELNLGDPDGIPLREFLQAIAIAETGRRKPQLIIPLGPVKLAVGIAEKMRLPLPISSDNLRGMEVVQRMDTRASLDKIGLSLTPFDDAMRAAVGKEPPQEHAGRPLRILLIGAGKIGIVHALNLTRREGVSLCGIVDRDPKAGRLYRSMGLKAPFRRDAIEAINEFRPDGAIVATPAATHLPLARLCMERNLPVLVEKPISINPEMISQWLALRAEFPKQVCHIGYMAAQYPHLEKLRALLAAGEFGEVRGFRAICLQSHIMAPKPVRWEMVKSQSGGGCVINFACHVLSMLLRLFGRPADVAAAMRTLHSVDVEDVFEARFDYGGARGFSGRLFASWSIPGYPRPDNRIVIQTSEGRLILDNYCLAFARNGKTEQIWTQRSFDIGYNAAPDYTGGGFSVEHANFAAAIRAIRTTDAHTAAGTPVEIEEAARFEQFTFDLYSAAAKGLTGKPPDDSMADIDERMDQIIASLVK
jgi:predicted dehydrogenase/nucleoside-diphosphate-sugar epimerase